MFIQIYTAYNEIDATLVQGRLEKYGIRSFIAPISSSPSFFRSRGTVLHALPWSVSVSREQADKAKEILRHTRPAPVRDSNPRLRRIVLLFNGTALAIFLAVIVSIVVLYLMRIAA